MSGNKTEKPTHKKKRDAAQKGQSFKSKDLITTCLILVGVEIMLHSPLLSGLIPEIRQLLLSGYDIPIKSYVTAILWSGLKLLLPFILLCFVSAAFPTLLQTGFMMAVKALKINPGALNPVNGFKKLFSLRTLKELVKTFLYLGCFIVAGKLFWDQQASVILRQVHASPADLMAEWGQLLHKLMLLCLACLVVVVVLDILAEYFLHIKDLKMDKQEVKREYKEQEGNQEIKAQRRSMHHELLSEQTKADIERSRVIIANPTHIAIGIYQNLAITPIPFISVMEKNQRALAVRAWAEKCGVPVVEDIRLARKIFRTHKPYSFVQLDELEAIMRLLMWLEEVENAWSREQQSDDEI